MRVRDLMTKKVETAGPDTDVAVAMQLMLWTGIRHLPVVADGRLIGILSERDVLAVQARRADFEAKVRDAMHAPVETAGPDDEVAEAAARMAALRIGCLPVVEEKRLIGILTTTDVLAHLGLSGAVRPSGLVGKVSDVMTRKPEKVSPDDSLLDAVALLVDTGVRHLPVVDADRRVVGILSDRDVRTAVGDPRAALIRQRKARQLTVSEVMTPSPATVVAGAPLESLLSFFVDERIGAVPVVDGEERLVGIVSYIDVLRHLQGAENLDREGVLTGKTATPPGSSKRAIGVREAAR